MAASVVRLLNIEFSVDGYFVLLDLKKSSFQGSVYYWKGASTLRRGNLKTQLYCYG